MSKPKISHTEFARLWNEAVANGQSLRALARDMDRDHSSVIATADRLRRKGVDLPLFPRAGGRVNQDGLRYDMYATAESLLDLMRDVQREEPKRFLTRNFFAHHTGLCDRTWTQFFGTFAEFKRQAGIDMTRGLHKLERDVATHVSRDHYKVVGAARLNYGEKYMRPGKGRFRTILAGSDLHDRECDPFWLRVFIDTARRAQPDIICLDGDVFDLPEFGKYNVDPRKWDASGRVAFVHKHVFAPLRMAAPNAQIDLIEGNHEFRLIRHMADASPAMMNLLSELHGMSVADLFGLPKYEINYIAKCDLNAHRNTDIKSEIARNWRVYYDCVLAHHFPEAQRRGLPGFNGHHHKHISWPHSSPVFGPFEWHQLGSGHVRDAEYCDGEVWHNGFALVHVDTATRATNIEYIPVTDFAVVGGKFYQREEHINDRP